MAGSETRAVKLLALFATVAAVVGGGALIAECMDETRQASDAVHSGKRAEALADDVIAEREKTRAAADIDKAVRYQVQVNGKLSDVIDGVVKLEKSGIELYLEERATRRFVSDVLSFEYDSRLAVGGSDHEVSIAEGTTSVRLNIVTGEDAKNLELARSRAVETVEATTGDPSQAVVRTIAGNELSGSSLQVPGAGLVKEIFVVKLGRDSGLTVDILRAPDADLAAIESLLKSITSKRRTATADFDLTYGADNVASLALGKQAKVTIEGESYAVTFRNRPMIKRQIGRFHFEHPVAASVAVRPIKGAPAVFVGIDVATIMMKLEAGPPSTLKPKDASKADNRVERTIGGRPVTGGKIKAPSGPTVAEFFEVPHGPSTMTVMIQYLPEHAESMSELTDPILRTLRVD